MNYWFLSHFPSSLSCVYCLFPFLFFSGTYEIYFFLKQSLNEYIPLLEERTCQAKAPWSAHSQPGGLPILPSGYHDLLFVHVHCELVGAVVHTVSRRSARRVLLATVSQRHGDLLAALCTWAPKWHTPQSHGPGRLQRAEKCGLPSIMRERRTGLERLGMSTTVCHFLCLWFMVSMQL